LRSGDLRPALTLHAGCRVTGSDRVFVNYHENTGEVSKYYILNTKYYFTLLLLLGMHTVSTGQRQVSFSEIDERVKSIEPATPAELSYTLTKDYTTEKEKLRSIFSWITAHISYRVRKNNITVSNYTSHTVFTDTAKWKSANDMVAETVLNNKSAVCDGYARLFKTLCDYAGLRSAIITGFAKGDLNRQLNFRCNHT